MKTRFCPSPTGSMHIGNARTALFSALYAKANNGQFLLRIEDTDKERSKDEYEQQIYDDLAWMGIEWIEGPGKDLGNGPYRQSERQAVYDKYYEVLIEKESVYPCFCSEKELKISRKTQLAAGKPPRYSGKCKGLTQPEIEAKIAAGEKPVLRFKMPDNEIVEFVDLVKGLQRFNTNDIGDFIVRRGDGTPPFMYCNAIDDSLMEVTHVVRGDDHLTNTPRQILILNALGMAVPNYAHISLILGFDGAPLSKRHGSSSVDDLREQGILPVALVNYLARLGHPYDNQLHTFEELAHGFDLAKASTSPAKFDNAQLEYWQKEVVMHADVEYLWNWMGDVVHQIVPTEKKSLFLKTVVPNILSPDDALYWAETLFSHIKSIDANELAILQQAGEKFFDVAIAGVDQFGFDAKQISQKIKSELNVKGKELFMPLRVAVTGETHGPEMALLFESIGSEELKKRFQQAKERCKC